MASKRCHYTASFKKKVIRYADEQGNRAAMRAFGINECNVRRWKKERVKINKMGSTKKALTGPKHGKYEEVENRVLEWVIEQRNNGLGITYELI